MSGSAPTTEWVPGYQAAELLRQGRRAQILRATRSTSGAEVIVKVMTSAAGRAEIEHLRTLDGVPGVVPLLDAGTTSDGAVFIVQPLYPDGSFGDLLAKTGPVPVQEASAVARSVSAALGVMHSRGLVHNDVCPGNVLRAGRTPVLTGFGIVHHDGDALPPPPAMLESFLHSAPEAFRGEPRTPASDIHQLASTIWTLLVGHSPFASSDQRPFDPQEYAQRALAEEVPQPPRSDLSRSLRRVLTRAMAKAPEDRYATPAEFTVAFEKARTGKAATTAASGAQAPLTRASADPAPSQEAAPEPDHHAPEPEDASFSGDAEPESPHRPEPTEDPPAPSPNPDSTSPSEITKPPVEAPGPQAETSEPPAPPIPSLSPGQRLEHSGTLRRGKELPTPEERERHGAVPDESPNGTADLMMAKLRGEEISPLRAWSRLEGWSGTVESAYLPIGEEKKPEKENPVWDPAEDPEQSLPRWRKQMHIGVAVCGTLAVTLLASAFAATGSSEPVTASPEPSENEQAGTTAAEEDPADTTPVEPSPPPAVEEPTEVTMEDTHSAVTLNWTDHSGGTASYFVLGGPQGHDPETLARTGPGAVTAQVNIDDPEGEFCFTVVAVEGSSAPADEVCTTRAADRAEAERQAEEEAEEEREEEEEADDDDDSSGSGSSGSDSEDSGGSDSGSGGSGSSGSSGD